MMKPSHHHHAACGHFAVRHDDHVDYLHDGQLHNAHGNRVDEHRLSVNEANPATCTGGHTCTAHEAEHFHSRSCGHPAVPHGDHTDFLVNAHLHHPHGGHCDHHGGLVLA